MSESLESAYSRPDTKPCFAEPVFIIGSYRSGTSALTWSLGQHANIFPLEETNWIYRLGVYLDCIYAFGTGKGQHSHLSSAGMTSTNLYKSFGRFVDSLVLDNRVNYLKKQLKISLRKNNLSFPGIEKLTQVGDFAQFSNENDQFAVIRNKHDTKNRWVDGTPENSHFVYCLNMMFPKAKFIFLIRNPVKVANSLMNFATVNGLSDNYEEEVAYHQWYTLTESSYFALKAYGHGKVLLIQQEDLVSKKEKVIEKCLTFLDEAYDENCLKPLQKTINSSQFDKSKIDFSISTGLRSDKKYVQKACEFYTHILNEANYNQKASLHFYRILRNRYLEHAQHFH